MLEKSNKTQMALCLNKLLYLCVIKDYLLFFQEGSSYLFWFNLFIKIYLLHILVTMIGIGREGGDRERAIDIKKELIFIE